MNEREEAGLLRLKIDLDEAGWPSPELLARYATDPNGMREDEKQIVERALASSRIVADELATLRGFDFSRLDDDRRAAEAGLGATIGAGAEKAGSGWLDWLRSGWLVRPPALAGMVALLALVYWLALSDRTSRPTSAPEAPPQLAEQDAPTAPVVPAPPIAPELEAPAPKDVPTTLDPSRVAAIEPAPEVPPQATPAPTPEREAEREEVVLLAMAMPDYRPAYGLEPQAGAEWVVRGGEVPALEIVALVPDHVARACSPSPVLHWSLDRVPEKGDFFLTIVDADDEPIVLDQPVARPARAGLQRLDLAAARVSLPQGRTLRWSIALREDEAAAPSAFDFGWLRVETPDPARAAELADGGDARRAAGYAELGCYSEAFEAALVARSKQPADPTATRAVAKLAEQAGFDAKLALE